MTIVGDLSLLKQHHGYGNLLAYLRNLPEMVELYGNYCFENGSRGRGNGKATVSPLGGSNIWLADVYEVVIIYQTKNGRGPLKVEIYQNSQSVCGPKYLSLKAHEIVSNYNLPCTESGPP